MQLRFIKILLLNVLAFAQLAALTAQPVFTARLKPAEIGINESTELTLKITKASNVGSITPPDLRAFIILGKPTPVSGIELDEEGNQESYSGLTYQLKPRGVGTFLIGSAKAIVDGKNIRSNALRLSVAQQQGSPNAGFGLLTQWNEGAESNDFNEFIIKKGEDVAAKIAKNIFLKVELSKTTCYVGEPLLVTYKLYTRLKSESNLVKNPSFNGFSVTDLAAAMSTNYTVEKFNGIEYNVYTLRKTQLYPLQAGVVSLETAVVNNQVRFIKEAYAGNIMRYEDALVNVADKLPPEAFVDEKITLETKPLSVTVKPLPEAGKPASFNGATGRYGIIAAVRSNRITTDDAGTLRIVIQGTGNFPLLNAPEFSWPAGIDGFEPKTREGINRFTLPISGSKSFEYSFTIAKPGTYAIPPIEYSYFDPFDASYHIIRTEPVNINVAKGTGKKGMLPAESTLQEQVSHTFFTNRWMIILPVALLIFAGLFFWLRADHKNEQLLAAKKNLLQQDQAAYELQFFQKNPLAGSETMLLQNNSGSFYQELNKELHVFLAERLKLPTELLTRKAIADELDKIGIGVADSLMIQQLLDDIMLQLYTPHADENNMNLFFERALVTVDLLQSSRN